MHAVEHAGAQRPARDLRLVGEDDRPQAGRLEPGHLHRRFPEDPKLGERDRGVRAAVAYQGLHQYPVAIEEGGAAAHRRPGRPMATYSRPGKSGRATSITPTQSMTTGRRMAPNPASGGVANSS